MSRLLQRAAIALVVVFAAAQLVPSEQTNPPCQTARDGTMPGSAWTLVRPEAKLSTEEVEIICAAARGDRRNEVVP